MCGRIRTGLTAASFIPGLDTVTNLAQIPVDLLRGDFLGAGLDLVGVIPLIGEAADVAKTARTADRIIDGVRAADKVADGIKAADAAGSAVGAKIGVWLGAAIGGAISGGALSVPLAALGGFIGGYFGGKLGGSLGEKLVEENSKLFA